MSGRIKLFGAIKEKLIRTKQDWAADGRLLTGEVAEPSDRLPPGQRLVKDWPVLDLGVQPSVPTDLWTLTVDGLVANPITWSWDDFQAQPQIDVVSDIHCVTSWSRFENHWQGVSTRHLLDVVQPSPKARHVLMTAHDGYTTNVSLDVFAAEDALLAHSWEGCPLTRQHGGPARLVIPQYYFWKSPKWIQSITFAEQDDPGFWEVRGYHNEGDPWKEERYG